MSSRYLDMICGQRRRPAGFQFTSKSLLALLALLTMAARRSTNEVCKAS